MTVPLPRQRQDALVVRYSAIPDAQERLSAIISRKPVLPPVPEEERVDGNLVEGCQSRVWITVEWRDEERCHFRVLAESALVRGLVALICEIYSDATPEEILAVEPDILERLGIARNLSPTRLNGVQAVHRHLVALARRCRYESPL